MTGKIDLLHCFCLFQGKFGYVCPEKVLGGGGGGGKGGHNIGFKCETSHTANYEFLLSLQLIDLQR